MARRPRSASGDDVLPAPVQADLLERWTSFGSPINIGAGFTSIPVTVNLGGLEGNTPYEIRFAATRPLGLPTSYSAPETFTTSPTPPSIESSSSSTVTVNSADLQGLVNPHGADTTVHFEYGTTPSYGQRTPDVDIGSALTAQPVQAHVEGLDPVVYHFQPDRDKRDRDHHQPRSDLHVLSAAVPKQHGPTADREPVPAQQDRATKRAARIASAKQEPRGEPQEPSWP